MADEAEIPLFTDVPPVAIALGSTPTNDAPELHPIAAVEFTNDDAESLEPRRSI
jgi:hypothetical protein